MGGWETQVRVTDTLFKALSAALPEAVPAGCKAMMAQAGFGILDSETGEYHCNYEALAGGYGGRAAKDGPDAVQGHGQNTENAPVEEIEGHFPVRITRLELIEDSEGAGKHRGGLGLRRDYHFVKEAATFTLLSDRDIAGPHGLFGGLPGRKAYYVLNPDGDARQLTSKSITEVSPGDTVSFQTPGGGGYGPAEERDPDLVARDVEDGKISPERGARRLPGRGGPIDATRRPVSYHTTATSGPRLEVRPGTMPGPRASPVLSHNSFELLGGRVQRGSDPRRLPLYLVGWGCGRPILPLVERDRSSAWSSHPELPRARTVACPDKSRANLQGWA